MPCWPKLRLAGQTVLRLPRACRIRRHCRTSVGRLDKRKPTMNTRFITTFVAGGATLCRSVVTVLPFTEEPAELPNSSSVSILILRSLVPPNGSGAERGQLASRVLGSSISAMIETRCESSAAFNCTLKSCSMMLFGCPAPWIRCRAQSGRIWRSTLNE